GQDIIAQWAFGGETFETSALKDPCVTGHNDGRTGLGWEATTVGPNARAGNAFLSDSTPPTDEDYIEFTSPSYKDDDGNDIPVLRYLTGNNSNSPAEAIQKDKYFQISVTANAGFTLNLSSLTFKAGRGGSATP